ncbi:hypothetical protein [Bartonella sp. AD13SXNS]|uniref:hypothetical protein n=1 Tax=Bartonella sp. AD13SXNS TaxID=3243462 RepID=UPI0035D0F0D0
MFFVICGLILPVVSMGARRARVKAEAFYCIFGLSLLLKEVLFYGVLGVVLFLALWGMENMDIPWGLLSLMGLVFAALLEWFLILHMRGWRDGVVTRCLWLLKGGRRCWSELFLFAFGSRETRVERALVREGLGVFRHLWIDPSCCFYGSRACACESGGVFKESGVCGVLQITSRE